MYGLISGMLNHAAHRVVQPDDFIYLLDKQGVGNTGVGHSAMLIQGEDGKWYFISKVGTNYGDIADFDDLGPIIALKIFSKVMKEVDTKVELEYLYH